MAAVDWMDHALCAEMTWLFFDDNEVSVRRAKNICAQCPVRSDCRDYALRTRQDHGVWGGMSEDERISWHRRATPGGRAPVDITYTTNARSTGTTCSAGRHETGWAVICRAHGATAAAASRTIAEYAVSRPEEWCQGCSRIASGEMPKRTGTL